MPSRDTGSWTLDLWLGEGIQRADGVDRGDQAARARQEMRDTGSADLFDAIADSREGKRRPDHSDIEHRAGACCADRGV